MEAVKIGEITYQWKLSLKSFNRAEEVYGYRILAHKLDYVTPGILPRLIWIGLMQHEIKTGEKVPTFDEVADWADEREGVFREFSGPCVEAINQLWMRPEDIPKNGEVAKEVDPDAPFLTGEKSTEPATSS